jgi:SAM-dependent methyltransferase
MSEGAFEEGTATLVPPPCAAGKNSEIGYTRARIEYWDAYVAGDAQYERFRRFYRQRLIELYRFLIPPGMRVLELGCGRGDLLASLQPSYGVGIDFSTAMIAAATAHHPELRFIHTGAHELDLREKFDYIICSDLVNELWDVQRVLEAAGSHCLPTTRFILNLHSNLWQGPRYLAARVGLARPQMIQNWLTPEDMSNLLYLAGFEVIRTSNEILCPFPAPLLAAFANRVLVKIWPFYYFGLANIIIARPKPSGTLPPAMVSVVVPARNEAGNIRAIFDRVPNMGTGTELIFVEGGSTDQTYETIEREMALRQRPMTKLLRQTGKGKGDAVRLGFAHASGELLMILDADLTVAPEDLPRFYDAWLSGNGDFINGVRLVYPMEDRAMRFFNLLGNKFFSLAFSFLLGQNVKDTACGTKVVSRRHYEPIVANRAYFGDFDRFGDFDLLFGAAKFNLKIVDLPIRYLERTYGETKMQRWRIGWLLLRMVLVGLRRLKFV